ncbi:MAG: deoxyribodipyrimidine photo-lyase [Armatimonadetes bacterium]|nr:deoxyribodipyrimidine photo-lyase [Armatimonadota bacterium]
MEAPLREDINQRYKRALFWFRRDLRLGDNLGLFFATQAAEEVVPVFVFDRKILDQLEDRDDRRLTFIHRSLAELDSKLQTIDSRLVVLDGDPAIEIAKLARALRAEAIFTNEDWEPYALERDAKVRQAGLPFHAYLDHVVFRGDEILTGEGQPFRVYTPFMKAWRARLDSHPLGTSAEPDSSRFAKASSMEGLPALPTLAELGFQEASLWTAPGEAAAYKALAKFADKASDYGAKRDFPHGDHTSGLSVHLRFGTISIRDCFRFARAANAEKWENELIWREFYQAILLHCPNIATEAFNPKYRGLEWPGSREDFEKWAQGQTGYPIVDAAMRCLNQTGWMHNRLRMVVASFLTKDLVCDYRWGEAYFARKLLDFDLASNNGGWQWSASTGADAQPYFRIFNPILQSKRFDPEGAFIREWLPELRELSNEDIHFPAEAGPLALAAAGISLGDNYPNPLVRHTDGKQRALAFLESCTHEGAQGRS